jgi:hypothetical protein
MITEVILLTQATDFKSRLRSIRLYIVLGKVGEMRAIGTDSLRLMQREMRQEKGEGSSVFDGKRAV